MALVISQVIVHRNAISPGNSLGPFWYNVGDYSLLGLGQWTHARRIFEDMHTEETPFFLDNPVTHNVPFTRIGVQVPDFDMACDFVLTGLLNV